MLTFLLFWNQYLKVIKKTTKLFVDCHSFDAEYQGVQTFLKEIYTIFLKKYGDVEIYFGTADVQNLKKSFPLAKEENIIRYKNSKPALLRYFFDIPVIIKKYGIVFAHFQYIIPKPNKNCRYIVTLHDVLFQDFSSDFSWLYRALRKYLFKKSFNNAAIKTTVSSYSKERIAFHYEVDENEIHLIPNGVNPDFSKNFKNKNDAIDLIKSKYGIENFVLYVSRIEPRKNHNMLLEAYLDLELHKKNISLVFIGKESIKVSRFTKLLSQISPSIRRNIHWLEQVSQEDLAAFYLACRVFVFPSKAEGFGLPPLEAAVCKVPVLCADATAMREFSFFDPYRFDPANQMEFRKKLEAIIHQQPDDAFLENIFEEVKQNYSWEKAAAKLYELIKQPS